MNKLKDIIKLVGEKDGSNDKIKILKDNKDNEYLKKLMTMTYDKSILYRIKSEMPEDGFVGTHEIERIMDIIEDDIVGRNVVGNEARSLLTKLLLLLDKEDAEIIHNMINRDLKIGVGAGTINKVWKGLIPEQEQMLAQPRNDKTLSNIDKPAYAQMKADGARCFLRYIYFADTDTHSVTLTTRQSNYYQNLSRIEDSIIATMASPKGNAYKDKDGNIDLTIDGELVVVVFKNHSDRSTSNGIINKSIKGTITEEEQRRISFLVWDLINKNDMTETYDVRLDNLDNLLKCIDETVLCSPFELIETTIINSIEEANEVYRKYVDQGFEGIILKNIKSLWENKRSNNLVKFKEEIEVDLEVVGYTQITNGEDKLGSLQLRSSCGKIEVSCGSGFKDKSRERVGGEWKDIPLSERHEHDRGLLWATKEELIGRIVQVKCNGLAKDKTRDTYSLSLPIFQFFREDKGVANAMEDVF